MTKSFVSEVEIAAPDPVGMLSALADFWAGHDVELQRSERRLVGKLGLGEGVIEARAATIHVRLESADLGALEVLRSYLTTTLPEFIPGDAPAFDWRGEMNIGRHFADFREVRLVSSVSVAPRIRRLTFTGEDVGRFGSETDIHVRLYFPPVGVETPEWPRPGADGKTIWPEESRRPDVRYYTVRRFDAARQEIEIDFVMHEDEGPGCAFAARAEPGAIAGMAGPVGRTAPVSDWTLLAGDETALPAIARILEEMPKDARGAAFLEIDGPADEIALEKPEGVRLRWLHRRGAPAGATDMLFSAIRSAPPPPPGAFAWVACEHASARSIRKHLRTAFGMPRDRHLVVAYWQREECEEAAA